jgi:hypothetical protein
MDKLAEDLYTAGKNNLKDIIGGKHDNIVITTIIIELFKLISLNKTLKDDEKKKLVLEVGARLIKDLDDPNLVILYDLTAPNLYDLSFSLIDSSIACITSCCKKK